MTFLVSVPAGVSPTVQSERKGLVDSAQHYKDAMLNRFYAICNCCSCCCGAMNAWHNGTPMLASSGYVAHVEADLCAGCGQCADYCQFAAITVEEGIAAVDCPGRKIPSAQESAGQPQSPKRASHPE